MLSSEQFADFVAEVHTDPVDGPRREPFPWQRALLDHVVEHGCWPAVIDVPTGLGKTSILDVAVFAAALGLASARRRIFYVVDRRLVVDEAFQHAQRLAHALRMPTGPVTGLVAGKLAVPGDADDDRILEVTRMRGGATWDRNWVARPDRYAIVTGTVDQVGSRLFFRGYGVSERARSIDAALAGTDSLILVDEAHLSRPFVIAARDAQTLDTASISPRPVIVTMSATADSGAMTHRISAADEDHPIAGARLRAAKRMHLVEVKTTKAKADRDMPEALASLAERMAGGRVVGVVVNTVARARAVFNLVRDKHDAVLLTGRTRAADRDYVLHTYYTRMRVDRDRADRRPLIVVATQTVEVGANVDFDALITESAPISSLVQRLGRLNRVAMTTSHVGLAVLVHDSSAEPDDPVYGAARLATWTWLSAQLAPLRFQQRPDPTEATQSLDVSPMALRSLVDSCPVEHAQAMRVAESYLPVLDTAVLDCWVRTSPAPQPDQPVEPFLHGVRDSPPPVTVVWRDGPNDPKRLAELVDELPPAADEGIELSVHAVRRWLTGAPPRPADAIDLDAPVVDQPDEPELLPSQRTPVVVRYDNGTSVPIHPRQIAAGDTIVVEAHFGGCDVYGWDPTSATPVHDVADLARRRGRPVVRLGPALIKVVQLWEPGLLPTVQRLWELALHDAGTDEPIIRESYRRILDEMRRHITQQGRSGTPLADVLDGLRNNLRVRLTPPIQTRSGGDADAGARPDRVVGTVAVLTVGSGYVADDDTALGSSTGQRIGLDPHQRAVARRAAEFARNLNLSDMLVASVAEAARWHDEGKRDPRFQTMLWNGDRAAAEIAEEALAKSGLDRSEFKQAQRRARYPIGMRHEALSARIAAQRVIGTPGIDRELVIHLVASHHGRARPLLPPVTDPETTKVDVTGVGVFDTAETVDLTHPKRFALLNQAYGRWGLALLETIVRTADIWCSSNEEQDPTVDADAVETT